MTEQELIKQAKLAWHDNECKYIAIPIYSTDGTHLLDVLFYKEGKQWAGRIWHEDMIQLIELAGDYSKKEVKDEHTEKFADLIRQDEAKKCAEHYLGIMRDAVEQATLKEREACAKLCDKASYWDGHVAANCAAAIRARSKE